MKKDVKVGERAKKGLEELRDADHQDIDIIHQENKQVNLWGDLDRKYSDRLLQQPQIR